MSNFNFTVYRFSRNIITSIISVVASLFSFSNELSFQMIPTKNSNRHTHMMIWMCCCCCCCMQLN